jgi:hypothetical protein
MTKRIENGAIRRRLLIPRPRKMQEEIARTK